VLFHKYLQWQLELQLAAAQEHARRGGLSIGLFHDLPLATDRCGFESWAHRSFYATGCRVGAPPDDFSPRGQDWSFPPPNAERHRQDGYRLFSESIRRSCRHGGALRIDHVMRFFRLYWIPDGMDATQGAYVLDRHEDLLRIVALESVRQKVIIVGEDLGTVPPEVPRRMRRCGMLSTQVLYFEKTRRGSFRSPRAYSRNALVVAHTHDLPPLAGFLIGMDALLRPLLLDPPPGPTAIEEELEAWDRDVRALLRRLAAERLLPPRADEIRTFESRGRFTRVQLARIIGAVHGLLASTPAPLVGIGLDDLNGETMPLNFPGVRSETRLCWTRRMSRRINAILADPRVRAELRLVAGAVAASGRVG